MGGHGGGGKGLCELIMIMVFQIVPSRASECSNVIADNSVDCLLQLAIRCRHGLGFSLGFRV